MKLSVKTALVPLLTVSLLTCGLYVLVNRVIIDSFDNLETQLLAKQVDRVHNSISNLIDEHSQKIPDWAQWDNTYNFMESLDSGYIAETLNVDTVAALGFSAALYLTPTSELHYGVQLIDSEIVPANSDFVSRVTTTLAQKSSLPVKGLMTNGSDVLIVAAAPILPNKADLPSRGTLVATSTLTSEVFKKIEYLTHLKISFWREGDPQMDQEVFEAARTLRAGTSIVQKRISPSLAYAYGQIRDLSGSPIITFRVEDTRGIVSSGHRVRDASLALLASSGIIVVLLLLIVINKFAVRRIAGFSAQVRRVALSKDSSLRLEDTQSQQKSLRFRTAGGVLIVFTTTTILTSLLLNQYFLKGFLDIEEAELRVDLERGQRALQGRLEKLKGKTIDWAQWDDTYQFVEDRNDDYRVANLGFDTLGPMNMNYVMYFNSDNQLIEGREIRSSTSETIPIDSAIVDVVSATPELSQPRAPIASFLGLDNGPILLAASPILDTSRTKPSRGGMIFATQAGSILAQELGQQTRLALEFRPPTKFSTNNASEVFRLSDNALQGLIAVKDILGRPVLDIALASERPIFQYGRLAGRILPFYFILGGMLSALITVICVNRLLLIRIRQLGDEVTAIKVPGEHRGRVTAIGTDELAGLGTDINAMLTALETAQNEVKKARDIAENANNAKKFFFSTFSHDLRNKVYSFRHCVNQGLAAKTSPATHNIFVGASIVVGHLEEGLTNLLDWHTVDSGGANYEMQPFDIRKLLLDRRVYLDRVIGEPNTKVRLVIDIDPTVPNVLRGDRAKLGRVIENLLSNSAKFTVEGYIGLTLKLQEIENKEGQALARVQITIWDTGIGIAPEKLGDVFGAFSQAHSSAERKGVGYGLGLYNVKKMAEGMGGTVGITSTVGKGTQVTIEMTLPIEEQGRFQPPGNWPHDAVLVAEASLLTETLVRNLTALGTPITFVDAANSPDLSSRADLLNASLVIVSETALEIPSIFNYAAQHSGTVLALIRSNSTALREQLDKHHLKNIIVEPTIAEEILTQWAAITMPPPSTAAEARPLRIVFVDDSAASKIAPIAMLESLGHKVVDASDGDEALEVIRASLSTKDPEHHVDVIITDSEMPRMGGLPMMQGVRESEAQHNTDRRIPIIALTAHSDPEKLKELRECGFDAVLEKPIADDDIKRILKEFVKP